MKLQKYGCGLVPKFSCGEEEIVEAYIWVNPEDPEEIYDIAYAAGYEVADKYETDEEIELDDDELEVFERVEFGIDENW